MKGEGLSFALPSLPSPVRACDFSALFSGDRMVIPSLTMMTGESSLRGRGEFKGWKGLKGALTVAASPLNLSDFLGPGEVRREKKGAISFRGQHRYPGKLGCPAGTMEKNTF